MQEHCRLMCFPPIRFLTSVAGVIYNFFLLFKMLLTFKSSKPFVTKFCQIGFDHIFTSLLLTPFSPTLFNKIVILHNLLLLFYLQITQLKKWCWSLCFSGFTKCWMCGNTFYINIIFFLKVMDLNSIWNEWHELLIVYILFTQTNPTHGLQL